MADCQPCIVRETIAKRVFGLIVFGGIGLLLAFVALLLLKHPGPVAAVAVALIFFVPGSLFFLWCAAYTWLWRIEIYADRIVKHYGLWTRTIRVSDLRGGRSASERVILESTSGVKIAIPESLLGRLDTLPAWMGEIDDLDARDFREGVDQLGVEFGATPELRFEHLMRLRKIAWYLELSAFALFLWAMMWPRPYLAALGASAGLALLAVVMALTGRIRLDPRLGNRDVRPSLFYCLFLPSLVLAGRAFHDSNLLDVRGLFEWSSGLALIATAILAQRSASLRRHGWPVLLCFALLTAYAAGVLCAIDVKLDGTPMVKYPVEVLATRRSERFDFIKVQAWGPRTGENEIPISGHLEHMPRKGDRVCVYMGGGRLGWRWYGLGDC